jgi:uncharacterized OB-fold protein
MTEHLPRVEVVENRYKVHGKFHHAVPGTPIWKGDKLCGVTNPRNMTYIHSYGGEWPFFKGLSEAKLIASRCDNPKCETKGSIYMPFRIHCPDCLGRNAHADITENARKTAKIHTFMICERSGAFNALDKPIKFINIEFDFVTTILMSYLSAGTPEIGLRVIPIFRTHAPTYTILDLSWVPEGTAELPEGFSFGV